MSMYHCSISNVSRAAGSASTATYSYISGKKVRDERTGQTFNYGRKERVTGTGTLLPSGAPARYQDAAVLFNEVEKNEKAANARTAKKIEVALPREFSAEQQKQVVEDFIRNNLTANGYAATYAIHTDKDNHNPHAHILVANRQINSRGEWETKAKAEYKLDENGQRIPRLDKNGQQITDARGRKQWVRIKTQQNKLDSKDFLQQLRKGWAQECNKLLSPEQQIDHRSHAERGIEEEPTIHEGYAARQIAARGGVSDRMQINAEIRQRNGLIAEILGRIKQYISHAVNLYLDPDYDNKQELAQMTEWIQQHTKAEIFGGKVVPPFDGQERLEQLRAEAARLIAKGDADVAQMEIYDSSEYAALTARESVTKGIVRSLTYSVHEGDKTPKEMLRRFKSAKHKAERQPIPRATNLQDVLARGDALKAQAKAAKQQARRRDSSNIPLQNLRRSADRAPE